MKQGGEQANGLHGITNLSNVDVGTLIIDLGVVHIQDGSVESMVSSNLVACVIKNDDVSRRTVLAPISKADGVAGYKIRASRIYSSSVDSRQLIAVIIG